MIKISEILSFLQKIITNIYKKKVTRNKKKNSYIHETSSRKYMDEVFSKEAPDH